MRRFVFKDWNPGISSTEIPHGSSSAGGGCALGHEGPFCSLCSKDFSRFSETAACQPCPSGQLKDSDGNTGCNSCLDTIFRQRGDIKYANARTVTRAAGSTDIYDCGARIADFAFRNARTSFRNDCSSGKLAPQSARSWFTVVQAARVAPL